MCRIHFAPCNPGDHKLIGEVPCRELCYQVKKYCPDLIKKTEEIDSCNFYPLAADYPTCYLPEVACPQPEAPSHSSVAVDGLLLGSEAKYNCNLLFDLKGNTTRTCQVSQ